MTYYASAGAISTDPLEGGIEISEDQYRQALAAMMDGKAVAIDGGFHLVEPPAPAPTPAPQPSTVMSTLDYFNRFTDAEYAAVKSGPMAIQRGLDMLIAAQYIDVTDPRVTQYLDALVTAGIINEARKTELLAPPA
ncbi:hypothetical protein [Candidimonas nitroreducens]|uniref:Uncharacterized protein n=1 Tax=Candidimonas nitroreducens TaxID=683354 RepID=A0A225ML28_9BURK|nr:hypothetical protein [Candidimonas nitroreducens]OWT62026.1 hypothetical protein CEY11_09480 [Candidimonas nitroreducens]